MPPEKESPVDNKTITADNKAPVEAPNLPNLPQQEEPANQESDDPEMAKWVSETKDLPNAYKRLKGSREEVERYRQQAEQAKKEQELFQQQLSQELGQLKEKDPDAFERLFGSPEKKPVKQADAPKVPDATEIARHVQAQVQLDRFYERNEKHIKDEGDWHKIQDLALGLMGKEDANGKPYSIQTALRDAMLLRHPELIKDRAVMEHLTSQAKRASASEPGDVPSDGASEEELTDDHVTMAQEMGVKLTPEARKRIAERKKKRSAS